ncbi:potassium/sodium_efflux_P-type_ATPase,_fungal-type [Candidozyma auris]|uniref:potassium/sodium_efflux_P-type_ATPase, _fungal-type n=1 Tax=Candidozyma auris TaxID=498019 RepID=UPI0012589C7A|nr:potassium/sodium_efflux_P-type_ATPase,_fungal-type [[Candida] auris]QEO20541.1 potassium/sodium_efflux_P-type_ATPase,_fungal-type [[Candida] auris]
MILPDFYDLKIKSSSSSANSTSNVPFSREKVEVQGGEKPRNLGHSSPSDNEFQPYRLTADAVASIFQVDVESGLSASQVADSAAKYGPNNLGKEESISYVAILCHQVFNAMVLVLIISMIIALAIRDWISGGVIAFVVFVNVFVGFIQEVKAEKTMGSLRNLTSASAVVIRENGQTTTINAVDVVPGDIVSIKVGDTIPADLRLIESMNLETDEALLTGESLPVTKNHKDVYDTEESIPVGDRLNMAYSSSIVTKGRATGITVATGLHTEIGKIASSLQSSDDDLIVKKRPGVSYFEIVWRSTLNIIMNVLGTNVGTPLQRKLSWLAIILFGIAVLFAIVVMATQKMDVNRSVAIYAICVALSMIPSSLIVVLTITMAIGAQVMVTKNVIVRKLDSLEALGGIDDICSDKTGTLTMGKMIARKLWIPSVGTFSVTNSTEVYNPEVGEVGLVDSSPKQISDSDEETQFKAFDKSQSPFLFKRWMDAATLANISTIQPTEKDLGTVWEAQGDATEIAINVFCTRLDSTRDKLISERSLEHFAEFSFDSSIKRMSSIYGTSSVDAMIYTKGAVERILDICDFKYGSNDLDSKEPLTSAHKKEIEENMNILSSEGLRVLAFAERNVNCTKININNRDEVETGLTFLGLIGIYDPPRPETRGSVKLCHKAGINVHMLTGDMLGTARAIAQEVGILPHNLYHYSDDVIKAMCMTATEFDHLSDQEIDDLPVLPLVIARCAPQTKVRMIEALHRRKKFCAMTGDGVNDSPSLKKADVGIAMGLNGSDVAKDASDIILTDDNFASILHAIEEGRRMSSNIQKFVLQLLAENVAQALYLIVGLAFFDDSGFSVFPLSPVETLWIIVVTSCFPAMGLGQEKASDDILSVPPNNRIFTRSVIIDMFVYGVWMAACCMAVFVIVVFGKGDGNLGYSCNENSGSNCGLVFEGRSAAFSTFTWCALFLAWECIHMKNSFFNMRPDSEDPWYVTLARDLWDNQFLFWSIIGAFISVFPVIYIPVINDKVFLHGPIGYEWGVSIAFTVCFFAGCEAWKFFKRRFYRKVLPQRSHLRTTILPGLFVVFCGQSRVVVKALSTLSRSSGLFFCFVRVL